MMVKSLFFSMRKTAMCDTSKIKYRRRRLLATIYDVAWLWKLSCCMCFGVEKSYIINI